MESVDNIEQFRQAFREEARELLAELETALLELNEQSDAETVGRIFRGLHTIKGSGAMFGFEELAAFTHELETAFDEVRQGRLPVSQHLTDLTLEALDRIRLLLEGERGEEDSSGGAILERLRQLSPKAADPRAERGAGRAEAGGTGRQRAWTIRFAPGPELMRRGSDPLLLLRDLERLGRLTLTAHTESIPPLAEMDPARCYIGWDMRLVTAADENAIRDVFIFVEDQCELAVEAEPDARLAAEQRLAAEKSAAACAGDITARGLEEKRKGGGRRTHDQENAGTLRVPAARLDQLVDLVGELVTVQARLSEVAARSDDPEVQSVSEEVERLMSALRENSMTLRMLPIRGTFERFRRLVHDLTRELGKQVELEIEGAETELDKTVIEQLADPLMHLVRNSMDHGIETAGTRAAAGKRETATIRLFARHAGGSVLVGVQDDGAGIDAEAVRQRAIERGLAAPETALTESQIYAFIFQPGFSTAKQVTDLSGRGVGMDVVRQRVESLRGSIEVTSRRGEGTTVTLRLPLTLAIIDGLLVTVGEEYFVLPLASTLECVELTPEQKAQEGRDVANIRGELIPCIRLRQHFGTAGERPGLEQIMVVEGEGGRCGLVVDRVLGNCQTVIRSLGHLYRSVQGVSGATILGNGAVALIVDPPRLMQEALRASRTPHPARGRCGLGPSP